MGVSKEARELVGNYENCFGWEWFEIVRLTKFIV